MSSRSAQARLKCLVVLLLGAGLLPAAAASAAEPTAPGHSNAAPSPTRLSGFSTARTHVRVGGELWSTVTVWPKATRSVTVQYRRASASRFTNGSVGTTSPQGLLDVRLRPRAAGVWQFRLVVSASAQAQRLVSPARTVTASGKATTTRLKGFASTATSAAVGVAVNDNVVVLPRTARTVTVQTRHAGATSFVTASTGRTTTSGAFRAVYLPAAAGVWEYRLVVRASATAKRAVSATRTVTALDVTPPGPVTGLTYVPHTTVTTTEVTLVWTNPTDSDFTGVMIRRMDGATAPTRFTGTEVVHSTADAATQYINSAGLIPGTMYSYAVFAHDDAPNDSVATNLTVTTDVTPTAAVLSVNGSTGDTAKATVTPSGTEFDLTGSHAGPGETLVSAFLDYQDGQTETLTGDPATWIAVHNYDAAGTRTDVTLQVTDSAGVTATDVITVEVYPTLTATITALLPARADEPVTFALTTSTPAGTAFTDYGVSYDNGETWEFIDGVPPATLTHTFPLEGDYTVIVDADNDAWGFVRTSTVVTVDSSHVDVVQTLQVSNHPAPYRHL